MILRGMGLAVAALLMAGALAGAETAAADATAGLCQRGARNDALTTADLLDLEAARLQARVYEIRSGPPGNPTPEIDIETATDQELAAPWAAALAEFAADLPESAGDLPVLIMLMPLEASQTPVRSLILSPQSALMPRILDAMDRQKMTEQARALRLVMRAFPDWNAGYIARIEALYATETLEMRQQAEVIGAQVDAASQVFSSPSIRAAALAMIDADPRIRAAISARIGAQGDDQRLSWLLQRLWDACPIDLTSPATADRSLAPYGSPQVALLVMDSFLMSAEEDAIDYYFADAAGIMAPQLVTILQSRGLSAHADALRTAMALFPAPYPRDVGARAQAYDQLTDDQLATLSALGIYLADEQIWDEMQAIAREAGLLP